MIYLLFYKLVLLKKKLNTKESEKKRETLFNNKLKCFLHKNKMQVKDPKLFRQKVNKSRYQKNFDLKVRYIEFTFISRDESISKLTLETLQTICRLQGNAPNECVISPE